MSTVLWSQSQWCIQSDGTRFGQYFTEVDIQAFLGLSSSNDMHNAYTTLPNPVFPALQLFGICVRPPTLAAIVMINL